ncbi:MAG: iron complex transport system permease protein [Moorella sp. (in: firmicutes)]|nr:iron complex transport system permease protein [Moorella sp. (in: firmicutes)]
MIVDEVVSFLGIIGFIRLVGPHLLRRVIDGDHRFLIPAANVMGGFLLPASETLDRTVIAPVVLHRDGQLVIVGNEVYPHRQK